MPVRYSYAVCKCNIEAVIACLPAAIIRVRYCIKSFRSQALKAAWYGRVTYRPCRRAVESRCGLSDCGGRALEELEVHRRAQRLECFAGVFDAVDDDIYGDAGLFLIAGGYAGE